MNNIEESLAKVGLTKQEARVYLALRELKEAQTGKICEHAHIERSNIYKVLSSLINKGLVSYRIQNNIKVFTASPPESLSELFKEKQKKLEEERKQVEKLISNLKIKEHNKEPISNYKYYEGIPAIKSMWYEINNTLTENTMERIYGVKKGSYELLLGFYNEHHKLRLSKKAKSKILLAKEDISRAKQRKNKLTQVRFAELKNNAEWGVVDDFVYLQHITTKTPRAFLIKDPIFAKTFEQVFDQIWDKAKE
jgi:sugar-specific transcriptional regulator TrmB